MVNRDMVGVAVTAIGAERQDYMRAQRAHQRDNLACHTFQWRLSKRIRVLILGRAGHPRVLVVKEPQVLDPEHRAGGSHLAFPDLAQVLRRGERGVCNLTHLAPRGANQPGAHTLRSRLRKGPTHDLLVVRVRKHPQQC